MVDVPPPPENPFSNEPHIENGNGDHGLDQGRPNVAAKPSRIIMVLGVVGLVLLFLLYNIFSGGKKEAPKEEEKPRPVAAAVELPSLPQTPNIAPPPLTNMAPPLIPQPIALPTIKPEDDAAAKKEALERMHSKMFVADGGGGLNILGGGDSKKSDKKAMSSDPNSAFEANVVNANSEAEKVEATQIGDLTRTIAQGRLIQATMESAMNTDLPAPVRAIVSRDTYAEAGNEPLIPKGSRLIGIYNTDIGGAQSRVFVVWTRVIRPDGVDVMLNSPLVDQIGQAGIGGQVDTKFQDIFSRSIMSSIVGIAMAIGSDKISGGSTTTTNSALGGSSTTGDASTTATVNALNRLGSVSDSFLQRYLDVRPTILVDQGTEVNVFVNRDLIFPAKFTHTAKIVN